MAGAGLDARAIELVSWSHKKRIGPLAYVVAGLKALAENPQRITVEDQGSKVGGAGQMILVGNGRLYGGSFQIFPGAESSDGMLEVCIFPRANWLTLIRCALPLLIGKRLPEGAVRRFRSESFVLSSASQTPFEVDGELAGHLPATFSVKRAGLRVLVPERTNA
jgi:diacylglycerol kinase family enzyme